MYISTTTLVFNSGLERIESLLIKEYVNLYTSDKLYISKPRRPRLQKRNPNLVLKDFKNQISVYTPLIYDGLKRNINTKICINGTLHITGCKYDTHMIKDAIDSIAFVIEKALVLETGIDREKVYSSMSIKMINSTFENDYKINQQMMKEILIDKYDILSIFEPKTYSGLKAKYKINENEKTSFLIFKSGKVIVAGSKSYDSLKAGYDKIKLILDKERKSIELKE